MRRAANKIILWPWLFIVLTSGLIRPLAMELSSSSKTAAAPAFSASGVIEEISADQQTVTIRHGAISNFMAAMTMPFKVRDPKTLAGFQRGDQISFQLHVTTTESWVDKIVKTGSTSLPDNQKGGGNKNLETPALSNHPLLHYKFTNELGEAVSLDDFRGQALAITFIYTRCPLPEFCPRLSKNFQEAAQQLKSLTNAPANWHFLSVTFDPEIDSPAVLKAYGGSYNYDPAHWSFLTGPPDKIAELARECGVQFDDDGSTINHNFRTLIVDAAGHLQMVFPTTGDLSGQIVSEMLKAAAATNQLHLQK